MQMSRWHGLRRMRAASCQLGDVGVQTEASDDEVEGDADVGMAAAAEEDVRHELLA